MQQRIIKPFGINAAEKEKNLEDLYLSEVSFSDYALDPSVTVILGRKGSGKTALARYFRFESDDPYDIYVDIDEPSVFTKVLEALVEDARRLDRVQITDQISNVWSVAFWTALFEEALGQASLDGTEEGASIRRYLNTVIPNRARKSSRIVLEVLKGFATIVTARATAAIDLFLEVKKILDSEEFVGARDAMFRYLDSGKRAVIVLDTLEKYEVRKESMQFALAARSSPIPAGFSGGGRTL